MKGTGNVGATWCWEITAYDPKKLNDPKKRKTCLFTFQHESMINWTYQR